MTTTDASAQLKKLLELDGVIAAGDFTTDGEIVTFEADMDMTEELASMSAQFCATVSMLFNTLAGSFTQLSGMDWTPQHGWMYAGGDYTVAVGGTRGVFAETEQTDMNELYAALVGEQ